LDLGIESPRILDVDRQLNGSGLNLSNFIEHKELHPNN